MTNPAHPELRQAAVQATRWHELKTDPEVFDAVASGAKTHEIRRNDRGFQVGDGLLLRRTRYTGAQMHMRPEACPLEYTGETERRVVSHVLSGYGLGDGWVILSFASPGQEQAGQMVSEPIDMVLFCPKCGMQHIDAPEFRDGWFNPPHRSHLCRKEDGGCGYIWRPADVPTNGVAAVKTKGSADSPLLHHVQEGAEPKGEAVNFKLAVSRVEDDIAAGKLGASTVFTRMRYLLSLALATPIVPPAAQPATSSVSVDTLRQHWLRAIECDHATGRDKPHCACSLVDLGWHPSVGAAVEAWLAHVSGSEAAPAPADLLADLRAYWPELRQLLETCAQDWRLQGSWSEWDESVRKRSEGFGARLEGRQ